MKWTENELRIARAARAAGRTYEEISQAFGGTKSAASIRGKLQRIGDVPEEKKRIKWFQKNIPKRALVYGDLHYKFQDDNAIAIMLEIAEAFEPDSIVINGDLLDCHEISDYDKTVPSPPVLKDEIAAGKEHLIKLRSLFPKATIVFNEGNHDQRILRYISKHAKPFMEMDVARIDTLLGLAELGIIFYPAVN